MTIARILEGKGDKVISIGTADRVGQAATLLTEKRIGCVPVVDGDQVMGIMSERDVVRAVAQQGAGALDQPVSAVMTSPAVTIAPSDPVISALSLMTRRRIRHLPVMDGGRLVGFVSIGDLVKYRIDRIESEAAAMRDYIQSV